jgi:hypothetical protein
VKPVLQALVLAERVYEDVGSGKKIIAGTFSRILFSRAVPQGEVTLPNGKKQTILMAGADGGSPYAYLSMTDVCKGTELILRFVNIEKNIVLFGTKIVVEEADRLGTVELSLPLPKLPIAEAGLYALEVMCEGEILGSHRIEAEELPQPSEE